MKKAVNKGNPLLLLLLMWLWCLPLLPLPLLIRLPLLPTKSARIPRTATITITTIGDIANKPPFLTSQSPKRPNSPLQKLKQALKQRTTMRLPI